MTSVTRRSIVVVVWISVIFMGDNGTWKQEFKNPKAG
jgi:hypothetical protein